MMKFRKIFVLLFAAFLLIITGCAKQDTDGSNKKVNNNVKNEFVQGEIELSSVEKEALDNFISKYEATYGAAPFERKTYPSLDTMIMDLNNGRIDMAQTGSGVSDYLKKNSDKYFTFNIGAKSSYHMTTRLEDEKLASDLSKAIDELKKEGIIDELVDKYVRGFDEKKRNSLSLNEGKTYLVGVTGDYPPFDYITSGGTPSGFNVALMNELSKKMKCNFKFVLVKQNARLAALEAKKIDIIFLTNFCRYQGYEPKSSVVCLTDEYYNDQNSIIALKTNKERVEENYNNYFTR